MPLIPTINAQDVSRIMTDTFLGFNHNLKIQDGEFWDTTNLTTDYYPLMANRAKRGTKAQLVTGDGMIEKDALAYVDNGVLYVNDLATPLNDLSIGDKQLVGMGAYICVFPDKKFYNTSNPTDYGSMEFHYSASGTVTYQACKSDGTLYGTRTVSSSAPENPANGEVWVDTTSGSFYEYSSVQVQWVVIPTVYVKITLPTMGQLNVSDYDGVSVSGAYFDDLNGSKIIYAHGGDETHNDYIVVIGIIQTDYTDENASMSIDRTVPDMDYVCESQNRLWGCFYGNDGTQNLNEIYCCALGDFKNWRQYLGVATDSWTASVGSDGPWTGAINYLGYPVFFKENCLHTVAVSSQGAHQISETECRGVQYGSSKSLAIVGETLFYKSRTDVCAYQGGFPVSVSEALGEEKYSDAVAGVFGEKYYISMKDSNNAYHLFVFDTGKNLWIREDNLQAKSFAHVDDELFCIDGNNKLMALHGGVGTLEEVVSWSAESGLMTYEYPDMKYVSRYNIRLKANGTVHIFLEYDSSGEWIASGEFTRNGTNTQTIPIRPRRCDHLRVKLTGEGDVRIYSIARILEQGSDV